MLNCDGFNITQHRSLGIGIAQFSGTALIFWLHFMLDLLNYVVSDSLDLLSITKYIVYTTIDLYESLTDTTDT